MHDIEPFHKWRDYYIASEDKRSPFFRRKYNEFYFTKKIYNYYIHPQWDGFGSETLYLKVLFTDYEDGYTIIELLGEWNDAIANDILTLKKFVLNRLGDEGVSKFIFLGENLLNYHADDDAYYEEWYEEVRDNDGWVALINFREHVLDEMKTARLHHYINFGALYNDHDWRLYKPQLFYEKVKAIVGGKNKLLR